MMIIYPIREDKLSDIAFRGVICVVVALIWAMAFSSCSRSSRVEGLGEGNAYAHGFALLEHDNFIEAIVYNPWEEGSVMVRYYLVNDTCITTPADGLRVIVPLSRIVVTSCTHVGFLDALGELKSVCGVCNPDFVYTVLPHSDWLDTGDAMQLSIEHILLASPQAVMLSTYAQGDNKQELLQKAGVVTIINNEWTEQHPLARAEWIRFVGAFYGLLPQADSVFAATESAYHSLCGQVQEKVSQGVVKKTILSGSNFRGTWYVPSGATYMGQLFADAGAAYYYAGDSTQGSLPLSVEQVLLHFRNADVWVGCDALTLEQLAKADEKHTWFKAWQTGQVFNFLRTTRQGGANDFWESGVVHPDRLLSDLVWVLYPDLLPADYVPFFVNRLQ
ncbi:MAG: ABC transporter substrate-binding protein [Paludibacter sp.]|nr:ABC transporter substrate-binding protein [Bacteroidales bacterium]MCM1069956.1 ABC transporter substrate-binding protein [Prevotella sp.]MCM1354558.1 ABC transporter substrate-binding protein [Bacteroides sp.]MCM1443569.1 ABC transporter substrate-binding protein [Muribaculum sp.]MCM1482641.1 ABC transporter substrate-binding protein [Paludibacter sp.]